MARYGRRQAPGVTWIGAIADPFSENITLVDSGVGSESTSLAATQEFTVTDGNYETFDFSEYAVDEIWTSPSSHGRLEIPSNFTGCWYQTVDDNGNRCIEMIAAEAATAPETYAGLIKTVENFADHEFTLRYKTLAHTRTSGPPNVWEVSWVFFRYVDDDHFYWFLHKLDGLWEIGRGDPAYGGGQRFLASGDLGFAHALNTWYEVRVRVSGPTITVWLDDALVGTVTDTDDGIGKPPSHFFNGAIAPYVEDAKSHFDDIVVVRHDDVISTYARQLPETGAGADASITSNAFSGTESGTSTENVSIRIIVSDSGSSSENGLYAQALSGTDSGAGTDTSVLNVPITATDTGGLFSEAVILATQISVTETGSGSDTSVAAQSFSGTDSGISSENATVAVVISATDTGAGADVLNTNRFLADSGSGTDITSLSRQVTDSGTDSENATFQIIATDTGSGSDIARNGVYGTDTGAGTDTSALSAAITVTEAGGHSDSAALTAALSLSDTLTGVDTTSATASLSATESGVFAEALVFTAVYAVTEAGSGTENRLIVISSSDTGAGSDASILAAQYALTESGTGAENGSLQTENTFTVGDNGSGIEAIGIFARQLAETAAGSDTSAISQISADTGTGSEVPLITVYAVDIGSSTDANVIEKDVSDTGTGAEVATFYITAGDVGTGADASTLAAQISVTDTGAGSDTASLSTANTKTGTDSGTGIDALAALARQVPESGSGTDTSVITILVSEAATATESVDFLRFVFDSGAGTDASSTLTGDTKNASDSGIGIDAAQVAILVSDEGLFVEVTSQTANISVSDSGSGLDLAVFGTPLTGIDEGYGTDQAFNSPGKGTGTRKAVLISAGESAARTTTIKQGRSILVTTQKKSKVSA